MRKGFQDSSPFDRYQEAIQYIAAGDSEQGLRLLKRIIRQCSGWIEPRLLVIETLINNGNLESARRSLSPLIARSSNDQRIRFLQGRIEEESLNLLEAEQIYLDLINQTPIFESAVGQIGKVYILQEQWEEAERWILRGLQTRPKGLDLITNLSVALLRQNRIQEAKCISEIAIHQAPENADILVNHGTILQELGLLSEAELCYKKALFNNPSDQTAISNLGVIYFQKGNFDLAESHYRSAINSNPDDIRTKINLAGLLMLTGRFEEGWHLYESRIKGLTPIMDIPDDIPLWDRKQTTKKLLLIHEQGLGDTFQFIRYAKILRGRCKNIEFVGPLKLHPILMQSDIVDACHISPPLEKENYAGWTPLMSLAAIADEEQWETHHEDNYLMAKLEHINFWTNLLGSIPGLRIGLHWQGNPNHEFSISRGRSFPLECLAPLAEINDIEFISLQKGPGSEQLKDCSFREKFHRAQEKVDSAWGFTDVAAILKCCDLVISSDSGLAHLAGALGCPVWLMLPHLPEWRWGLSGRKSIWYKNHTLFRQLEPGDWSYPVKSMIADLNLHLDLILRKQPIP